MPKILIIDLAKHFGGADVRVAALAQALHGRQDYAVATLSGSPLQQRLVMLGLNVLPVPYSRSDPRTMGFLRRAIREGNYSVVDAHNPQSQFWGHLASLRAGDVRKVSTMHSAYRLEHNESLKGRAYEQIILLNQRQGCHFIAVSEAVNKYLQEIGIDPGRISLIHNAIEIPPNGQKTRDHELFHRLGWGDAEYVLITVARLEAVKGLTVLIEALRQVMPEYPHLRALLVGDGRARAELEKQAQQSGLNDRIHFAGFRDDITALLAGSDAFCLPSLSEGLPYALLEACAAELPVLASRVGGMAEVLTHKETAYLVPPADAGALADGLRWLLNDPQAAALGQQARAWAQQNFNQEDMIKHTLAVYGV
jgi:glycosyltransferase involved in cell wall biosynthesis